ncbi:MAG: S8 family serine peptidase [Flavobacteriales bacterium]
MSGLASAQTAPLKYWVQFTDKADSPYSISAPTAYLSQEALDRRATSNIEITEQDLPVNPSYLLALQNIEGVGLVHTSKWFNAATVSLLDSTYINTALPQIQSMNSVLNIRSVAVYQRDIDPVISLKSREQEISIVNEYGPSFNQVAIHDGHLLHELDFRGQGVKIGVFDSGFSGINFLQAFEKLRSDNRIKEEHDIVDGDNNVLNGGTHGMYVLGIMTAYMTDSIIGAAPEADYYLFRTENGGSEYITEEDNWVHALEMADSIGVQLVNSSLGYTTFDDTLQNHTYADMDGNTTRISRAADIASAKGMLIVNSAGNSGNKPWKYIGAPADADSVLAVGAVGDDGLYAFFSSIGPSSDGDVKPNVCGVGYQTVFADFYEGISKGNGTSFSAPVVAGLAACLWQAFPEKSNMDIKTAIEQSSSTYLMPSDTLGYGIPNFYNAYRLLSGLTEPGENRIKVFPNPFSSVLNLDILSNDVSRIRLTNSIGQEVLNLNQAAIGSSSLAIRLDQEVTDLVPGVYWISVFKEGELLNTQPIVKVLN